MGGKRGKFRQNPFEYSGFLCCLRRMKKNLLWLAVAALASMAFTSCYYDPYYGGGSTTVGGSYSSGYGDGYGYGGSSFNTSVFVSTGNPRWGYDPYCYSYYDYSSRRSYDPYLNGYYPIGYRPPVVYGVPHPYGYRRGYCPPPRYISSGYVSNYRNREYRYRNSSYGWAKQVREQPRQHGSRPSQSVYDRQSQGRPNNASRPNNAYSRDSQYRNQQRESSRPSSRQQRQNDARQSSRRNNTLVNSYDGRSASRQSAGSPQRQQAYRQQAQRSAGNQQRAQAQQRQQSQRQQGSRPQGGGGQRQGGEKEGKRQQGYR
jgi:hypothetical protein